MSAIVMNGDVVADDVKRDLSARIEQLVDRGVTPGLGTILVGDDGPSAKYVSMKHDDAAQLGLHTRELTLPATASQDDVDVAIEVMNNDPRIDAYIVQYPFPAGLDYDRAILEMDPAKDADGLHPVNLGLLVMGVRRADRLHAGRDPAAARVLRGADRRATRRDRGPGPDDRTPAGQPAHAQASGDERRGHRRAHRRGRPRRATPARPTSSSPPRARPGWSRPTWCNPARPSSLPV